LISWVCRADLKSNKKLFYGFEICLGRSLIVAVDISFEGGELFVFESEGGGFADRQTDA
jgi:hypothetical protein